MAGFRDTQWPAVARGITSALLGAALFALAFAARAQSEDDPVGPGAIPGGTSGAARRPATPAEEPKAPVIVPPQQTKFVDAPYPKEASDAGIQATVVLKLTIDKTGKVTAADVLEPAGHGFDEAAQAAALQFEFSPATRDGKPVPAVIPYKYAFTLKEVQAPPAPPPTTGNLSGHIRIAIGDAPLVGAEVVVIGPDGASHKATTDVDGKWEIDDLPAAFYRVTISAEGFSPVLATEEVVAGTASDTTDRLTPSATKGVEVTVQGERPPREVTRRTVSRREMMRIPGTSGDALRSLQSLPGVARPPGFAGLLIVRGSAPEDTQIFVDGAAIPLIYHFGGLSSAFPTELLDRIDFYPSNFSAKYGQAMGGVVDVALRQPDTTCNDDYGKPSNRTGCFHAFVEGDLIDNRFLVQGPIGKDWSFVAAGRRSWFDVWLKPVLKAADAGVTSAPVYSDYQLIAETKPTRTSRLSLRFFGSDDRVKLLITDPLAQDPALGGNVTFATSFYRAQAVYETELSRSVELNAMLAVGRNDIDFGFGPIKFTIGSTVMSGRSEFGFKIMRGLKLHTGLDFLISPYDVFARGPAQPRPGEADPGPIVTRPILTTTTSGTLYRPAWYAEAEVQPTQRALLVPSLRVDYARDSGHTDVSPRINGRYDFVGGRAEEDRPLEERRLRTTLKGGVGVFYQPPQPQETNVVFGTPGLLSNRAIHYSIGIEQELTHQIELSIEGYYKNLTSLVARTPALDQNFVYGNQGSGSVIGMETLIKYKPDSRFFGWFAYTLSRSVRRDSPSSPEYLFQYDQTHNLTVLGSYRLGRGWEIGARFRVISGNLDTPVAQPPSVPALYASDAGAYTALSGKPFSTRLPLFHQLDIRVDKAWQFRTWRLSAYLDVQNVYNYAAREAISYNYNFTQSTYQQGIPIIPSLGIRGEI
jgi:TonB family protein